MSKGFIFQRSIIRWRIFPQVSFLLCCFLLSRATLINLPWASTVYSLLLRAVQLTFQSIAFELFSCALSANIYPGSQVATFPSCLLPEMSAFWKYRWTGAQANMTRPRPAVPRVQGLCSQYILETSFDWICACLLVRPQERTCMLAFSLVTQTFWQHILPEAKNESSFHLHLSQFCWPWISAPTSTLPHCHDYLWNMRSTHTSLLPWFTWINNKAPH